MKFRDLALFFATLPVGLIPGAHVTCEPWLIVTR
jgi:hypothetical protein